MSKHSPNLSQRVSLLRGREGKRERGREGERERGREGERERGREGDRESWSC